MHKICSAESTPKAREFAHLNAQKYWFQTLQQGWAVFLQFPNL
jgi:hypothetical protein